MGFYTSALYLRSPVRIQEALLSGRNHVRSILRENYSGGFARELELNEQLDLDTLRRDQWERLKRTLHHACTYVPFYRERFRLSGLVAEDFQRCADLERLPLLTRREVVQAGVSILSEGHRGPRFMATTSGTTGVPLTAWRDLLSIRREAAFVWRQLRWAGIKPGDRRVWLRGDKVVPAAQKGSPFWRHVRSDRMLVMSSYHLGASSAGEYVDALTTFDPVAIQAYPSSIQLLARSLVDQGRRYKGRSLRAVVTSSETVTDDLRRLVESAFGCPVFDHYGSMERVVAIGTCEHGNYHLMPDYSYAEFLPGEDGNLEAVGTSFDNMLMPFVRYRQGDIIVPAPESRRCACGRVFPLIDKIVGRIEDAILTTDGRHVFMASNVFDCIPNIVEGQIRQDRPGEVRLLLVGSPGTELDVPRAIAAARSQLGREMVVCVERVRHLERTPNGKLQMVVSALAPDDRRCVAGDSGSIPREAVHQDVT